MSKWWYAVALPLLMSLSGCIEITTYVSPSASGTVIDAASQRPIQGAAVSVDGHPGLFAQTNADGEFVLQPDTRRKHIFVLAPYESLAPSGTVVVSADGYVSREIVVQGSANSLSVSLNRVR
jgi:VCBS repeat-containing protein